jgi:tRNA pseudouridine55 synthase
VGHRGSSNASLVIGIDKPKGMSSHDVVDRVREIYSERRVGHTGTLDPAATGVLVLCVGPATRLDQFLTGHQKSYDFDVVFGTATDTDDAEGTVIKQAPIPSNVRSEDYAISLLEKLIGDHQQLPPIYSAITVHGQRAYKAARKGSIVDLKPRAITIYRASLRGIDCVSSATVIWHVSATVSKGTYIRSLARDIGHACLTCAHTDALRRTRSGRLSIDECLTLDELASDPYGSLLDPVRLLDVRCMFLHDEHADDVKAGRPFSSDQIDTYVYRDQSQRMKLGCGCSSGVYKDEDPLTDGEIISMVLGNRLLALYRFDAAENMLRSACGFAIGVERGYDISR